MDAAALVARGFRARAAKPAAHGRTYTINKRHDREPKSMHASEAAKCEEPAFEPDPGQKAGLVCAPWDRRLRPAGQEDPKTMPIRAHMRRRVAKRSQRRPQDHEPTAHGTRTCGCGPDWWFEPVFDGNFFRLLLRAHQEQQPEHARCHQAHNLARAQAHVQIRSLRHAKTGNEDKAVPKGSQFPTPFFGQWQFSRSASISPLLPPHYRPVTHGRHMLLKRVHALCSAHQKQHMHASFSVVEVTFTPIGYYIHT